MACFRLNPKDFPEHFTPPRILDPTKVENDCLVLLSENYEADELSDPRFGMEKVWKGRMGWGVRATRNFALGHKFCCYKGKWTISDKVETAIQNEKNNTAYFSYRVVDIIDKNGTEWEIDAGIALRGYRKTFGRLFNHDGKNPNCYLKKLNFNVNGVDQFGLFIIALRDIVEGEDLVWNYGHNIKYWRKSTP